MSESIETVSPASESRRPGLTRELITETAITMVDEGGLSKLTMRSLGQELGVEAMSLYRYVNGREDLLESIVQNLVDQIEVNPHVDDEEPDGWQALLQWLAQSVRKVATAHPTLFPLMATRHPAAPWLRPPLRTLKVVEEFLDGLMKRGFEGPQAVDAYRIFTSFLIGHLLLETADSGSPIGPLEEPLDETGDGLGNGDRGLDLDDFPRVQELSPLLAENHSDAEFERALEAVLDRIEMIVAN